MLKLLGALIDVVAIIVAGIITICEYYVIVSPYPVGFKLVMSFFYLSSMRWLWKDRVYFIIKGDHDDKA